MIVSYNFIKLLFPHWKQFFYQSKPAAVPPFRGQDTAAVFFRHKKHRYFFLRSPYVLEWLTGLVFFPVTG